jgi:hypothetical protein
MKTKISGFFGSVAFILISSTSFGQLNVGAASATKATTTVNTAAINNAVSKSTQATKAATNTAVTKATQVSTTAVTKVNSVKPEPTVKANAGISAAIQVSAAGHNSGNQSNGNGNSETGTTILTFGQTDAVINAEASDEKTMNNANETKTKIKDKADKTKTKTKDNVKKVKEKVHKDNHGLEVSTEAKAQGEIKRQNQ